MEEEEEEDALFFALSGIFITVIYVYNDDTVPSEIEIDTLQCFLVKLVFFREKSENVERSLSFFFSLECGEVEILSHLNVASSPHSSLFLAFLSSACAPRALYIGDETF